MCSSWTLVFGLALGNLPRYADQQTTAQSQRHWFRGFCDEFACSRKVDPGKLFSRDPTVSGSEGCGEPSQTSEND